MKTKAGFTIAWGRVATITSGPEVTEGKVGLLIARPSPWDPSPEGEEFPPQHGRFVEIAAFVPMDKEEMARLGTELLDNFDREQRDHAVEWQETDAELAARRGKEAEFRQAVDALLPADFSYPPELEVRNGEIWVKGYASWKLAERTAVLTEAVRRYNEWLRIQALVNHEKAWICVRVLRDKLQDILTPPATVPVESHPFYRWRMGTDGTPRPGAEPSPEADRDILAERREMLPRLLELGRTFKTRTGGPRTIVNLGDHPGMGVPSVWFTQPHPVGIDPEACCDPRGHRWKALDSKTFQCQRCFVCNTPTRRQEVFCESREAFSEALDWSVL